MASPEHPEQLVIALEPEAASIYCRRLRMNQLVPDCPPAMQPLTLERNRKLVEVPEVIEDRIGDHLHTGEHKLSSLGQLMFLLYKLRLWVSHILCFYSRFLTSFIRITLCLHISKTYKHTLFPYHHPNHSARSILLVDQHNGS